MALLNLKNVSIEFPIFNSSSRSFKNRLLSLAISKNVGEVENGTVLVKALKNLTFDLYDGDRVALIGNNGAGKTTLLRVINGVYYPTSGSIDVKGKMGSLIDISLGINPELTGRENIYIRSALLGISISNAKDRVSEIINFSELGLYIDLPMRTYSSGMHLRLAFSISMLMKPDILVMDEWLSVGDGAFQDKASRRLNNLIKSSKILVLATHSKDLILNTCNKIIWLENGAIKDMGSVRKLIRFFD